MKKLLVTFKVILPHLLGQKQKKKPKKPKETNTGRVPNGPT